MPGRPQQLAEPLQRLYDGRAATHECPGVPEHGRGLLEPTGDPTCIRLGDCGLCVGTGELSLDGLALVVTEAEPSDLRREARELAA